MGYRSRSGGDSQNRLSDRDMLLDLLSSGKYMSSLYDTAVMESSNRMIRDTFESLQQDEHQIAEEIFGVMQQEGWYSSGSGRQKSSQRSLQSDSRYGGARTGAGLSGQDKSFASSRSRARSGSNILMD